MEKSKLILWFDEVGMEDVPIVGGKVASLGELYNNLTGLVNVPYGFAVTSEAYRYFLSYNNLEDKIKKILDTLDVHNVDDLRRKSELIRAYILSGDFPPDLREMIADAYRKLSQHYGQDNVDVAVRSSATAEDLPDASFAGQQDTFLNVRGVEDVYFNVKRCFASLFTDRAISYRANFGFDHFSVGMAVGIQKMVRSDLSASGVMFTAHPEVGFKDIIIIESLYGLGIMAVGGEVTPDEFVVHKPTLKEGYESIVSKKLGTKLRKAVYNELQGGTTYELVRADKRSQFSIEDEDILQLARWGVKVEEHYSRKAGKYMPMDIEWAKDGIDGKLYLVQARPLTSYKELKELAFYRLKETGKEIARGIAVGNRIAAGRVKVLHSVEQASEFQEGDILVTEITNPDWEPIMQKASGIITEQGGRTSHAAIVSRELGIPAIVGAHGILEKLNSGEEVTMDCTTGEEGIVYEGILPVEVEKIPLDQIKLPKTVNIMMNVGNPTQAYKHAMIPNKGVGLARIEFIFANFIKVHPLALLNYDQLEDEDLKKQIKDITKGYPSPKDFFIAKLAEGIGTIASAFWPNPVIVRFSDFKSNEYARLLGGNLYEPQEENPMLGYRGASRYYSDLFKPAFMMEVQSIRKVRDQMGLTNVKVMIPFVRTPEEAKKVLDIMEEAGYPRGANGLEVYMMVEIPSNVVLLEEFAPFFDGFSIGSNDLTQLTLGVDRDSSLVAHVFDERNEAVKRMLAQIIEKAHGVGKPVGICGQAPSDFPEIAEFLVIKGIDSISLIPDTVPATASRIYELERRLGRV